MRAQKYELTGKTAPDKLFRQLLVRFRVDHENRVRALSRARAELAELESTSKSDQSYEQFQRVHQLRHNLPWLSERASEEITSTEWHIPLIFGRRLARSERNAVSAGIRKLGRAGLVSCSRLEDGRIVHVSLTEAGMIRAKELTAEKGAAAAETACQL